MEPPSSQSQTLTAPEREPNAPAADEPFEETTFGELINEPRGRRRVRCRIDGAIVWLVASVAFLGYLAFGSFSVQVWRLSEFLQQYYPIHVERRILHIWIYQAEQLPDVKFSWWLEAAYYAALFVCIAGAIYGLWLLLDRAGTGASHRPARRRPPRIEG